MRKNFKTILKLFAIGTLFVLGGCEAEKDLITETKNSNPIKEYTFKQISQQPKFNNAYRKFNEGLNTMKMTNRSADSDFEIDSTTVKEVTEGDKTTYTMAIKRPTPDSSYFENLIIQSKAGDTTKAYIAKFTPNQAINQNEAEHSLGFKGTVQVKEIAFDSSSISNRLSIHCISIRWCNIGEPVHEAYGPRCNCIATTEFCYSFGTDQGATYNYGSGGSNYYGGNNGGGNGGIAITPVVPCTRNCPDVSNNNPCETLAPLMQEPTVNTAIAFLKPKVTGGSEFAYAITHGWDPTGSSIVTNTEFIAGASGSAPMDTGGKIMGCGHNHPVNGQSIPSWGDIRWTMNCELNNNSMNDGTAFNMVVVRNSQNPALDPIIYAITINDLTALQAQIDADMALPKVQEKTSLIEKIKYMNNLQSKAFGDVQDNTAAIEKKFLEYFSNYGVNLSKFDPVTNKWNNLKLQNRYNPSFPNAANTVLSEPCN